MKITLLKKQGKSEVVNREELSDLVDAIKNGLMRDYNALVVLEVNDLVTYEKAVEFGFDIPFMEHMASFDYGYKIAAVRDWLFKQSK